MKVTFSIRCTNSMSCRFATAFLNVNVTSQQLLMASLICCILIDPLDVLNCLFQYIILDVRGLRS